MLRDPLYGNITFPLPVIKALIATKEFERLRYIKQLGGAQFIFPGATHTRYLHCIGVYHLLAKICEKVPAIKSQLSQKDQELLLVAGLLHDIGHGPFSHSFEAISHIKHEAYTIAIITDETTEVNQVLKQYKIDINQLATFFDNPSYCLIAQLISSQLDADRMDYLKRDAYFAGVAYGEIDTDWIIENMTVADGKIAFNKKAVFALENYLLSRYYMHLQIYHHPVSMGFDILLQLLFRRLATLINNGFDCSMLDPILIQLATNKPLTLSQYLSLNDYQFSTLLWNLTIVNDPILSDLARRFQYRDFFRMREIDNHLNLTRLKMTLKNHNYDPEYYFIRTRTSEPVLYDESTPAATIHIIDKNKVVTSLCQNSLVIKALMKIHPVARDIIFFPNEINKYFLQK